MTNTKSNSNSNPGSLRLVLDDTDLEADVVIEEPPLARTDFWKQITLNGLADRLIESINSLGDGVDDRADLRERLVDPESHNLSETIASFASNLAGPHPDRAWRQLGSFASLGHNGISEITQSGPIALLEAAGKTATVDVSLPAAWPDADSRQRSRWLSFLVDLSSALSISLRVSRLDMRVIVEQHEDLLPASCVNEARQTTHTETPAIEQTADKARQELGDDNPHWRVLAVLSEDARECVAVADLSSHMYLADVSRSGVSKRVTRLEELGLVKRITVDGQDHVSLLPSGAYALSEVFAGDTAYKQKFSGSNDADQSAGVNDPGNFSGITVYPQTRSGDPPSRRPTAEADSTTAGPSSTRTTTRTKQKSDWMRYDAHHAAAAATRDVTIATCDDNLTASDHSADLGISKLDDEIVVSFEASRTIARTAARLALSLSDNRLMVPIFEDVDADGDLSGLVESDPVVLRLARQIGYLSDDNESGAGIVAEVKAARQELLDLLHDLGDGDDFDEAIAQELTRKAHGLAGSLTHLYEMAGYEVIRSIEIPKFSQNWNKQLSLVQFVAHQTAICSRYGHYPLFRVQCEQRDEKRNAMLSAPDVDPSDPKGETVGKWVLRGSGIGNIEDDLANLWDHLESVDEDAMHYKRFLVDLDVGAPGREEIAMALTRLASTKRLQTTRDVVSVMHALTDSIFDASEALFRLGSQDLGQDREIYLSELRTALTALSPDQIMPQVDYGSTGAIMHALLSREGDMSTAELANAADVSKSTLKDKTDLLEAIGLIEITDPGRGKSKRYQARLPWSRGDQDLKPEPLADEWFGSTEIIHDYVHELLIRLGSPFEDWSDTWMDVVNGEATVLALTESIGHWLIQWVEILSRVLASTGPRAPQGPQRLQGSLGSLPGNGQISLDQAVDRLARADGGKSV